ncbi:MAG: ABC transporter permease [Pseudomonadota bacterium]
MNDELPKWIDYGLIPFFNLVVAFLVAGLVVLFVGENPLEAARLMVKGAFGYGSGIGFTLFYATNFIFTGLAVAVAFHAGLFNIGGEGQALVGGLGAALVAMALGTILPWYVNFPLLILGTALFGALWALIPAWLQATRGSHIVITTIMFNFIGAALVTYLLSGALRPDGSMEPASAPFPPGAQIPKMDWLMGWLGIDIRSAPFNISFLVALLAAYLVWLLIWRTRFGYEVRTTGVSPSAAVYAGIPQTRTIIVVMLISGALAGMMAMNTVVGSEARYTLDNVAGAGFVGIAVALMGRSHPAGIIPAAILFGALYQGGAELAFDMPAITRDMIVVIQGLVILFAGAMEHMFRPSITAIVRNRRGAVAASAAQAAE